MATPRKLDVLVAFFAYGGNGGVAMELPAIRKWWARTYCEMQNDPRIGRVADITLSDTPITMTRNQAVRVAKEGGFDLLVMVDSDNEPDIYTGDDAKPFWKSSFDFVYSRGEQPTCIFAPYCGPPPHPIRGGEENPYIFRWINMETDTQEPLLKLATYSRAEASQAAGIIPVGAGPTGLILYTMNCFDYCGPSKQSPEDVLGLFVSSKISAADAIAEIRRNSWFHYEWETPEQTHKCSTEDVVNTRNISMGVMAELGIDAVFCNFDAWAGHHKPKCVGKPTMPTVKTIAKCFIDSVRKGAGVDGKMRHLDYDIPPMPQPKRMPTMVSEAVGGSQLIRPLAPKCAEPGYVPDPGTPIWDGQTTNAYSPSDGDTDLASIGDQSLDELMPAHHRLAAAIPTEAETTDPPAVTFPQNRIIVAGQPCVPLGESHDAIDHKILGGVVRTLSQGDRPLRMLDVHPWDGLTTLSLLENAPDKSIAFAVGRCEGHHNEYGKVYDQNIAKAVGGPEAVYARIKENFGDRWGFSARLSVGEPLDKMRNLPPQELDIIHVRTGNNFPDTERECLELAKHLSPNGALLINMRGVPIYQIENEDTRDHIDSDFICGIANKLGANVQIPKGSRIGIICDIPAPAVAQQELAEAAT